MCSPLFRSGATPSLTSYSLLREETADVASNKTIGSGIRRYYFEKALG
jgi:hypothetical protein